MKARNLTIALFVLACGCAQEIEIENLDAHVTSIGTLSLDERANVVVPFSLRDEEGDDQAVLVTVCTEPDTGCGPADEAPGGDPMTRLPTVPDGTDVPHEFRWQPWCGRWIDQELVASELEQEYVVGFTVLSTGEDPVYSEPFTLAEIGAVEVGECP